MFKSEDSATPSCSSRDLHPEASSPRYRIGTRFLRVITGWGLCEGVIDSFDGTHYSVKYQSINIEDTLVDEKMFDRVTITTNWDTHLLDVGQQVWVFTGKGKHSGVIVSIRRPDNRASVKWDSTNAVGEVDLDTVFPMFVYNNDGSIQTSSHSKRKRNPTQFFHNGNQEELPRTFQTQKGSKPIATGKERQGKNSAGCLTKIEYKEAAESPLNNKNVKKVVHLKKRKPATRTSRGHRKQKEGRRYPSPLKSSSTPNSTFLSLGPGWTPKYDVWIHPKLGLELTSDEARNFQLISDQLGGDEEAAYAKYKKSLTSEQTGSINCVIEALAVNNEGREEKTETPEDFEQEFKMLSDYYLNQRVRRDEEIPGGMVLRAKLAQCQLLRSKSEFRRMVHKRVMDLQRTGEKREIHRLLKKLHDHDISGREGDGPSDLWEEFLGKGTNHTHHDVEIIHSKKSDTAPKAIIVEDLSVGMSCDQTTLSSLSESLPITASTTLNDCTKVDNQIVGNDGESKSDSFRGIKDSTKLVALIDASVDRKPSASESYGIDNDTKLLDLVHGTVESRFPDSGIHDNNGTIGFSASGIGTIGVALAVAGISVKEDNYSEIIDLTEDEESFKTPASFVSDIPKAETSSIDLIDLSEDNNTHQSLLISDYFANEGSLDEDLVSARAWSTDKSSLAEVINLLEDD